MQELTVAGLELRALHDAASAEARPAIARASEIVRDQQARLRQLVTDLQQDASDAAGTPLAPALDAAIAALQRNRRCHLAAETVPADAELPAAELLQLRLVLAAVVSELDAASATSARITVAVAGTLNLTVRHDGTTGRTAASPALAARLRAAGGMVRRTRGGTGAVLSIRLARP